MPEHNDNNISNESTRSMGSPSGDEDKPLIDRIGQFRIESVLGSGGMGTIYRAYDESMKRKVALKVLHSSLSLSTSGEKRFAREAWIAGQLEHPNIVKVFSRGKENNLHYIAMELVEGGSLSDFISEIRKTVHDNPDSRDTVSTEHVDFMLDRFIGLCSALQHIHSQGFIHRDIKPQNILLSGTEKQFKLTDFGIAHAEDMTRMTRAGDFIGTVRYMSPELIAAHRAGIDLRSDIYSLGVTLYESVTLDIPFIAKSEELLIREILAGHAVPARRRNKRVTRDLETVLMKTTHHDPDRRYDSAQELGEDIERVVRSEPIKAKRSSLASRGLKYLVRNRKRIGYQLLVLIIILSITAASFWSKRQAAADQQILQTLRTVAATGESPFDIDANWGEHQERLLEILQAGEDDSITFSFFRANSLFDIEYQRYGVFPIAPFNISPRSPLLFDSTVGAQMNQVVGIWKFFGEVDGGEWVSLGRISDLYGRFRSYSSATLGFRIGNLADSVSEGHHTVIIRRVSEHYLKGRLFDPDRLHRKRTTVVFDGDTVYEVDGITIGGQPYLVLDEDGKSVLEPSLVDTSLDSLEIWTFSEYPEQFPKLVRDTSGEDWVRKTLNITDIRIVKTKTNSYHTVVSRTFDPEFLRLPIAVKFLARQKGSSDLLLSGYFRILKQDYEIFYENNTGGGFSNEMKVERATHAIDFGHRSITELAELGKIDAELELIPSKRAARIFGDVLEVSGDTVFYDITFQAFDSSGNQK